MQTLEAGSSVADRLIDRLGPMLAAERVFGEAVERDGVTVIPVASLRAGGGGGGGDGAEGGAGAGEGAGFGVIARPAGAYVIEEGTVHWEPALDVNRIITAATTLLTTLLFVRWRVIRARLRSA